MQNVVFSMKEYGHIEIHLKELMEERGVTRNALARATNTRFEVINKWYQGHVEKIDADVLSFKKLHPPSDRRLRAVFPHGSV